MCKYISLTASYRTPHARKSAQIEGEVFGILEQKKRAPNTLVRFVTEHKKHTARSRVTTGIQKLLVSLRSLRVASNHFLWAITSRAALRWTLPALLLRLEADIIEAVVAAGRGIEAAVFALGLHLSLFSNSLRCGCLFQERWAVTAGAALRWTLPALLLRLEADIIEAAVAAGRGIEAAVFALGLHFSLFSNSLHCGCLFQERWAVTAGAALRWTLPALLLRLEADIIEAAIAAGRGIVAAVLALGLRLHLFGNESSVLFWSKAHDKMCSRKKCSHQDYVQEGHISQVERLLRAELTTLAQLKAWAR